MNPNDPRGTVSAVAPIIGIAILLLVSPVPLGEGGLARTPTPADLAPATSSDPERHDPITILNDADLVPPDAVSGNGVRGGSGTPHDPYVIANWTISSTEDTAIHIQDVHVWIAIRNVTIVQDDLRDDSFGIFVRNVDHLTLTGVNVTGLQSTGIHVQESNVTIRDSRIAVRSTPDPDAEHPAGRLGAAPAFWDGRGVGVSYHAGVSLRMVENLFDRTPIFVKPECVCNGTKLTFVDNTIRPYNGTLDRGYFRGDRIRIESNKGYVYYRMDLWDAAPQATFHDNQAEALDLRGNYPDEDDTVPEVVVPVRDNTFRGPPSCNHQRVAYAHRSIPYADPGCRDAISVGNGFAPRIRIAITGNRFEQIRQTAVDVNHARASVRDNAFVDNGPTDEPRVWIRADLESYRQAQGNGVVYQEVGGNDFVRDAEDRRGLAFRYSMEHSGSDRWARNEDPNPLPATDNYWGPAPPDVRPWPEGGLDELETPEHPKWVVVGNVTVEPHAVEPNVLSPEEVQRYLDEAGPGSPLGGPSATALVTGLLVGLMVSVLYGWRKRS